MPNVSEVRPRIWDKNSIIDLYDDGEYSAIWGCREGASRRSLGVRWNGDEEYVGYPNQGRNPVWYSEPEFLQNAILASLLIMAKTTPTLLRREEFSNNILIALKEC